MAVLCHQNRLKVNFTIIWIFLFDLICLLNPVQGPCKEDHRVKCASITEINDYEICEGEMEKGEYCRTKLEANLNLEYNPNGTWHKGKIKEELKCERIDDTFNSTYTRSKRLATIQFSISFNPSTDSIKLIFDGKCNTHHLCNEDLARSFHEHLPFCSPYLNGNKSNFWNIDELKKQNLSSSPNLICECGHASNIRRNIFHNGYSCHPNRPVCSMSRQNSSLYYDTTKTQSQSTKHFNYVQPACVLAFSNHNQPHQLCALSDNNADIYVHVKFAEIKHNGKMEIRLNSFLILCRYGHKCNRVEEAAKIVCSSILPIITLKGRHANLGKQADMWNETQQRAESHLESDWPVGNGGNGSQAISKIFIITSLFWLLY